MGFCGDLRWECVIDFFALAIICGLKNIAVLFSFVEAYIGVLRVWLLRKEPSEEGDHIRVLC